MMPDTLAGGTPRRPDRVPGAAESAAGEAAPRARAAVLHQPDTAVRLGAAPRARAEARVTVVNAAAPAHGSAAPGEVRLAADLADLALVFEPGVQIVHLPRGLDPAVEREVEAALRSGALGSGVRTALDLGRLRAADACPALAPWPALAADLDRLVELMADLTDCPAVGLRIETLDRAMCPRFHTDRVAVRLLVTWRGPATEWLDGGPAAAASGERGIGRAATGDIVLLKGTLWPGNGERGALHRSPPVPDRDAPRVLVALDPLWSRED